MTVPAPTPPAPLGDGTFRPRSRAVPLAWLAVGLGLLFAYVAAYNVPRLSADRSALIGVILSGVFTLFFLGLGLRLLVLLRRATLVVNASGLRLPLLNRPAGDAASPSQRIPYADLGRTFLFWADGTHGPATRSPALLLVTPGQRYYQLILTDRDAHVVGVFMSPSWSDEVILGLSARLHAQTGGPQLGMAVPRLPFPWELPRRFTPEDAGRLAA